MQHLVFPPHPDAAPCITYSSLPVPHQQLKPRLCTCRQVKAAKVAGLWRHSGSLALLSSVGFRPVVREGDETFLVLEGGPLAVPRCAAASDQLA